VPFFLAGTVAAVNAVVTAVRLRETRPEPAAPRVVPAAADHPVSADRPTSWRRGTGLAAMAAVMFAAVLAFSGFESTFALFGEARFDLTEASTAALFLGVGLLMVAVQAGAIGPLTSAFGSRSLLVTGLVTVAAGMAVLATARTWVVLVVALALLAAGQSFVSPSNSALVAELAPPDRRGEALGSVQSAGALARVAGPLGAGALFEWVGESAPYVVGAVLTLLVAVAVRGVIRPSSSLAPVVGGAVSADGQASRSTA
jgi:DHA1 family tetracycline resistance protein-like MFS transporter